MKHRPKQVEPCITFTAPSYALFDLTMNGVLTTPHGNLAIFTVKGMAEMWARNSKTRLIAVVPVRISPDNGKQESAMEKLLNARCLKAETALRQARAYITREGAPMTQEDILATIQAALPPEDEEVANANPGEKPEGAPTCRIIDCGQPAMGTGGWCERHRGSL